MGQTVAYSDALYRPILLTELTAPTDDVNSVILVEHQNVVLTASLDLILRIYDLNLNDHPKAVFDNYYGWFKGLAQLDSDLVATISHGEKRLIIWYISETYQVGHWKHTRTPTSFAKLGAFRILLGDCDGDFIILKHYRGTAFLAEKSITDAHSDWIYNIAIGQNIFVKTAIVWDTNSLQPLATLKNSHCVSSAAINDRFIVTASRDGCLHIFENTPKYSATEIQLIDNDVVALACFDGFFDFITLSQNSFISRSKISDDHLNSFAVLPDAQIAVVGDNGFACIFSPPSQVQDAVQKLCFAFINLCNPISISASRCLGCSSQLDTILSRCLHLCHYFQQLQTFHR